jgi:hypothetical protein
MSVTLDSMSVPFVWCGKYWNWVLTVATVVARNAKETKVARIVGVWRSLRQAVAFVLDHEISGSHGSEYEDGYIWVVKPWCLIEVYRRFRGACCLHYQGDRPASTSETSINFYQAIRRSNPKTAIFLCLAGIWLQSPWRCFHICRFCVGSWDFRFSRRRVWRWLYLGC